MLRVGVIGATGYTGEEIVKILADHSSVKLTVLQAIVEKEQSFSSMFPALKGKVDIMIEKPDEKKAAGKADLFFLALPHKVSMQIAPKLIKAGKKVIDLSADYRLSVGEYEKWYGIKHTDKENIKNAVYGLPEINKDKIKKSSFVANPGCYPTSAALAIIPLIKEGIVSKENIIIDAKSGASGAGRKASIALVFSEVNENLKAYKINEHQHKPEINMALKAASGSNIDVVFVPHLIPMNRGILSTIYMDLTAKSDTGKITALFEKFYKNEPFVNVMDSGKLPAVRDVRNTNFCSIGVKVTGKKVIVVSCIDNLLKGASGQAVQNMNIMCGFSETEGL